MRPAAAECERAGVAAPSAKLADGPSTSRETGKLAGVGTGYSGSTLDKVDTVRKVAESAIVRHRGREVRVTDAARDVAHAEVATS